MGLPIKDGDFPSLCWFTRGYHGPFHGPSSGLPCELGGRNSPAKKRSCLRVRRAPEIPVCLQGTTPMVSVSTVRESHVETGVPWAKHTKKMWESPLFSRKCATNGSCFSTSLSRRLPFIQVFVASLSGERRWDTCRFAHQNMWGFLQSLPEIHDHRLGNST